VTDLTSPHSVPPIFGGMGYSVSHPSRWAGYEAGGMARLTVVQDCVVLSPLWLWRRVARMPVVRIPLSEVESVFRITWGIKFSVPGDPALDGTRFKRWVGGAEGLERLIELMQSRGITVQTMPRSERIKGLARDYAVAQRPGWIWRDRGRLGFLESAVNLALAFAVWFAVLFVCGVLFDLPALMLVWLAFIVAVVVWGWFAGYRLRKKLPR
jgi:hypothetical protein